MQAVTEVNVEQASKEIMRKPTCPDFREGRCRWEMMSDTTSESAGVSDDGMYAQETGRNTGSPRWWRRGTSNRTPARDRPGHIGWRKGP